MNRAKHTAIVGLAFFFCAAFGAACASKRHAETKDRGDTVTILIPRDAEELDPRFLSDPYGLKISRLIFASLFTIDPQTLEIVPDLATDAGQESPTSYVVRLRPGLRFSDSSTLDSKDVVATFQGIISEKLGSRYRHAYSVIEKVEAIDALSVRFTLREPRATFLSDLEMPIVREEDAFARINGQESKDFVGAGPFVLSAHTRNALTLTKNPRWYGGAPLHESLRFLIVRDDNTRVLRALAGDADLSLQSVPPLLVPMFEDDTKYEVHSVPGIATMYLGINTATPWLADVRVRQAIAHAIDLPALIQSKYQGRAEVTSSWIPRGHWADDPALPIYSYNPQRANELLDAAGLRRDPETQLRARCVLRTNSERFRISIAKAIAAMLGKVGIEARIMPTDTATMIGEMDVGRFDLALLEMPEVLEPHVLSWFFASDRIPGPGNQGANRWRYRNPELDATFAQGIATNDQAQRKQIYARAQEILARDLPVIPLWQAHIVAVTKHGFSFAMPRDGRFATLAKDPNAAAQKVASR